MLAPKPSYRIDDRTWMPLSRAAALLATNVVGIKRLMGSGELEWCQLRAGSTTLFVDEAAVFARRKTRGSLAKQRERRATAETRTAQHRGRSMLVVPPAAAGRQSGLFVAHPGPVLDRRRHPRPGT